MARNFNGSTGYLSASNAAVTAYPLTVAGWFRHTDIIADGMFAIYDSSAGTNRFQGRITSGHALQIDVLFGGNLATGTTANAATINQWAHGAFVFNSATDRRVYLNANDANKGSNTTDATPGGTLGSTVLASRITGTSTVTEFFAGDFAEWGVWNAALSLEEITSLARGFSPMMVRPEKLQAYWPINGRASLEERWAGSFNLTVNGTTAKADHPNRIIYPRRQSIILPVAAVGGDPGIVCLVNRYANHQGLIGGRLAR